MPSLQIKVSVIEDDEIFTKMICKKLYHLSTFYAEKGVQFHVSTFACGESFLQSQPHAPDILILDYHLNTRQPHAQNAASLIGLMKSRYPTMDVIILTAETDMSTKVEMFEQNIYDYIVKDNKWFVKLDQRLHQIVLDQILSQKARNQNLSLIAGGLFFLLIFLLSRAWEL